MLFSFPGTPATQTGQDVRKDMQKISIFEYRKNKKKTMVEIDVTKNKETFCNILRSTEREGVESVIEDLEKMGFFEAPASCNHHLNVAGGLVQHSLNTFYAAEKIWEGMKQLDASIEKEVKRDSLILAALLHDVCKADIYKQSVRKRKTRLGEWVDCDCYKVSYKDFPMGHGEKSVILLLCSGLELDDAEMLAIRWHMGSWGINMNSIEDQKCFDTAKELYPLVSIIQSADSLAAGLLERKTTDEEEDY